MKETVCLTCKHFCHAKGNKLGICTKNREHRICGSFVCIDGSATSCGMHEQARK